MAADIFGPLRPTTRGHTHILVLIDHHTMWVELIALPEPTTELVAEAFFEQWISRWGTMRALLTDNGCQCAARILQQLTEVYGIKHSSLYNSHGNPKDYAQVMHTGVSNGLGFRPASDRLSIPRHSEYSDGTHPVSLRDRLVSRSTAIA